MYGFEVVGYWTIHKRLQMAGSYTHLQIRNHVRTHSNDEAVGSYADQNARNLFYIRSYSTLPGTLELNAEFRFVGAIPGQEVSRYFDGNVHLFRSVGRGMRLAVTLENVMHGNRVEWDTEDGLIQSRNLRAGIEWRF